MIVKAVKGNDSDRKNKKRTQEFFGLTNKFISFAKQLSLVLCLYYMANDFPIGFILP